LALRGLSRMGVRVVLTGRAPAAFTVAPVVAAPVNDRREDATLVGQWLPFSLQQPPVGATAQGDKTPSCADAGQIVWCVLPNAPYTLTAQASGYDTVLAVYERRDEGIKEIACDNDGGAPDGGSRLVLTGHGGTTLSLAVGVGCDKKATTTSPLTSQLS
jgi:hypothetical protein